jgi:selenide,water dikinase
MGGKPMSALTLVCFPEKGDVKVLEDMLEGGLSKMVEAGCTVIGGHSVRDEAIKLGYSVTGTIHPQKVLVNGGARPGDRLLFTKAIGTGVISTAIKRDEAQFSWVRGAVHSMTTLNRIPAEVIARGFEVHGMTDVTGFGLIGHAREMALASKVSLRLSASAIPLLEGALECVQAGMIPGGLKSNRNFAEGCVGYEGEIDENLRLLLFDPQTAGGLLIAVAPSDAGPLLTELHNEGVAAAEIGEALPKRHPLITVEA